LLDYYRQELTAREWDETGFGDGPTGEKAIFYEKNGHFFQLHIQRSSFFKYSSPGYIAFVEYNL
jgi:hypothetical protein